MKCGALFLWLVSASGGSDPNVDSFVLPDPLPPGVVGANERSATRKVAFALFPQGSRWRTPPGLESVAYTYVWSPALRGDLAADGVFGRARRGVGESLGELGALEGAVGAEWFFRGSGRLGGLVGTGSLRQRIDEDAGASEFDLDSDHRFFEAAASWRLAPADAPRGTEYALDLLVGVRYHDLHLRVTRTGPSSARGNQEVDWFEPFVGLRLEHQWTESVKVWARGDLGGFAIGEAPQRVFHGVLGFEWQASENLHVLAGWRWEEVDVRRHGRSFQYDVRLQGPILGATLRY